MDDLITRLKQPASSTLYHTLQPLRNAVSFQAAFVAGCYQQVLELGASHIHDKYTFTWQKRLIAYRMLPDGTESSPPTDATAPPELLIGVIGCGPVGTMIVHVLLDAGFAPSQILVSTRSPQKHRALTELGLRIVFDNERIAARSHLLIVAVLPAQLPDVARAVRPVLSPRTLIFSAVAAVGTAKLLSLFSSPQNAQPAVLKARTDPALARSLVQRQAAAAAGMAAEVEATGGDMAASDPLAPDSMLSLSALCFALDAATVREFVEALTAASLRCLELPPEEEWRIGLHSAFGMPAPEALALQLPPPAAAPAATSVAAPASDGGAAVEVVVRQRFQRALEPLLVLPFR